ncbi:MAG: replicative DNA helicase [Cyclobacteriaceae bacterium]
MEKEKNYQKLANRSKKVDISTLSELGKLPPQAIEVEETVLGSLMIEKDALTTVIDILKPDSFYKDANQKIYNAILLLFSRSEPVDLITVTNQLKQDGELELVGGAFYVTQLTQRVNSAANIEYHARIVAQQAIKRQLISISAKIQTDAFEDSTDVFDLLDRTEQAIFEVSEANIRKNYADMRTTMMEALKELEERKNQGTGLTGIPSGFTALDRVTSGWQRSDMVIIAARPGMGKTAFVLSAIRNAAVQFKQACAIFSLEMSSVQLVNRLISAEAELESEKLRKGNLADHEWTQLHTKIAPLTEAPIFIDDTPALSILELRAKCRRLKAQHDIQLIVIDYLQLMSGDSTTKGNREQEIASISRSMKNIAKELNVPVLALSQLSRAVETRGGDKKPQLSDLRESGSIEQDADQVMFLYRPEYYGLTEDEEGNPVTGVGEVIIAKNRHGSIENVRLRFIGKYTKFCDLDNNGFGGGDGGGFMDNNSLPAGNFSPIDGGGGGSMTFGSKMNDSMDDEDPPF